MGTPADTLVTQYPDRISQLNGPVLDYFKSISKTLPFNRTEQDLYMAVFFPGARRVSPTTPFSTLKGGKDVTKYNPGINTPQDYINLVNNHPNTATLTPQEWTALKGVASKINAPWDSLYRLINLESNWDPKARNPRSGARGLIQFMPSTALWMGFKGGIGIATVMILAVITWFAAKKLGYL